MFNPIAWILHVMIGATLMGVAITVALAAGFASGAVMLGAAVAGLVAAVPVSWAIACAKAPPLNPQD